MLRQHRSRGFKLIACVSDTYDFFNAVENIWCGELLQEVKDSGMTVVVRPDSGDAAEVNKEALRIFARKLGSEMKVNSKGYMVLPDYYRLIQGDGNDDETDIDRVLAAVTGAGFSASNIAFGMGGGLLQKLDRDTQRFAYKVSAVKGANGCWRESRKIPKTDPTKASKGGLVDLARNDDGQFLTVNALWLDKLDNCRAPGQWDYQSDQYVKTAMETIFEYGSRKSESFENIRARAATQRLPKVG